MKTARFFYGLILAALVIRLWQGALVSQLANPLFISPLSDNSYWILHIFGLPQLLLSSPFAALMFDIGVFLTLIFTFLRVNNPNDEKKLFLCPCLRILSFLGLSVYFFTYNSANIQHGHQLIALWGLSFALIWGERGLRWLRLYTCFILASAAVWKIARLSAFYPQQLAHILPLQHAQLAYEQPDNWRVYIYTFLVENPYLAYSAWWAAICLQSGFMVGFFTHKADKWLFISLFLFVIMNYLMMNLYFAEFLPLAFLFLKNNQNQPNNQINPF